MNYLSGLPLKAATSHRVGRHASTPVTSMSGAEAEVRSQAGQLGQTLSQNNK